jgi:hypothetical protein
VNLAKLTDEVVGTAGQLAEKNKNRLVVEALANTSKSPARIIKPRRQAGSSVVLAWIWREVLKLIRLPLPFFPVCRSRLTVICGQIFAYFALSSSHFSSPGSVSG